MDKDSSALQVRYGFTVVEMSFTLWVRRGWDKQRWDKQTLSVEC